MANLADTKTILRKYNLRLKESLGQNFLVDDNILDRIISLSEIEGEEVLEIGPGIGNLTKKLARSAKRVVAVEIDDRLINLLNKELVAESNVEIVNDDALEVDFNKYFNNQFSVIANIPYYITSPIIMKMLEGSYNLNKLVVMVQKEVAERIAANPGGKDYGILSLVVQYYAHTNILFDVPSESFFPQPEVESSVIELDIREELAVEVKNKDFLFRVIKAAFQQRRKMVKNSLSKANNIDFDKEIINQALNKAGIDPRIRAEKIQLKDFAKLSNILYKINENKL